MKLRLFVLPNCPKCPAAKEVAEAVVKQRNDITLEVLDISDSINKITALMMQIASTPSFAIDDTPIFCEDIPSVRELNDLINEHKHRLNLD